MNSNPSIFVLGSLVVACCAKVARLPQAGESLLADAFTTEVGGKGFNVAVGAHRLGAVVDGLFAAGDDLFGDFATSALLAAGLSVDLIRRHPGQTGSGIGFTGADGENCLAVFPGANSLLSSEDSRSSAARISRSSLVLAQFEISDPPIADAFRLAREMGVLTLLNPSPFRAIDPEILSHTSILIVNRVEALHLASAAKQGSLSPDREKDLARLADWIIERGPDLVIITLGALGAVAFTRGGSAEYQSCFEVPVVDTLGAGDAFTAAFAAALVQGRAVPECLARAGACGAMVVRRHGVLRALPTSKELDIFIAEAGTRTS
jgi:ribokinase